MCLWASPTLLTEPKVFWALLRPSLLGVWFVRIKVGLRDWDVSAKEQSKPRALVDFINRSCIICYSWRWSILHSWASPDELPFLWWATESLWRPRSCLLKGKINLVDREKWLKDTRIELNRGWSLMTSSIETYRVQVGT